VELSQNRVSEIVGNTNFSEIDTLLSQGHDMDYPNVAKVEDAPYTRHQGRSRSNLLQVLDNAADGVSSTFLKGKQSNLKIRFIGYLQKLHSTIDAQIPLKLYFKQFCEDQVALFMQRWGLHSLAL